MEAAAAAADDGGVGGDNSHQRIDLTENDEKEEKTLLRHPFSLGEASCQASESRKKRKKTSSSLTVRFNLSSSGQGQGQDADELETEEVAGDQVRKKKKKRVDEKRHPLAVIQRPFYNLRPRIGRTHPIVDALAQRRSIIVAGGEKAAVGVQEEQNEEDNQDEKSQEKEEEEEEKEKNGETRRRNIKHLPFIHEAGGGVSEDDEDEEADDLDASFVATDEEVAAELIAAAEAEAEADAKANAKAKKKKQTKKKKLAAAALSMARVHEEKKQEQNEEEEEEEEKEKEEDERLVAMRLRARPDAPAALAAWGHFLKKWMCGGGGGDRGKRKKKTKKGKRVEQELQNAIFRLIRDPLEFKRHAWVKSQHWERDVPSMYHEFCTRPFLRSEVIADGVLPCDACNKSHAKASMKIILSGPPSRANLFAILPFVSYANDDDDDGDDDKKKEEDEIEFNVGGTCYKRLIVFHAMQHFPLRFAFRLAHFLMEKEEEPSISSLDKFFAVEYNTWLMLIDESDKFATINGGGGGRGGVDLRTLVLDDHLFTMLQDPTTQGQEETNGIKFLVDLTATTTATTTAAFSSSSSIAASENVLKGQRLMAKWTTKGNKPRPRPRLRRRDIKSSNDAVVEERAEEVEAQSPRKQREQKVNEGEDDLWPKRRRRWLRWINQLQDCSVTERRACLGLLCDHLSVGDLAPFLEKATNHLQTL